jgi:hypothetical protein
MTISTVTLSWVDIMLGMFFLMVWLGYPGSLVDDVIQFLKRNLNGGK